MDIKTKPVPAERINFMKTTQRPAAIKTFEYWTQGLSVMHKYMTDPATIEKRPKLISYNQYITNSNVFNKSLDIVANLETLIINTPNHTAETYYIDLFIKSCFDAVLLDPYFYVVNYIDENNFEYYLFDTITMKYFSWVVDMKELNKLILFNHKFINSKLEEYLTLNQVTKEGNISLIKYITKKYGFSFSEETIHSVKFETLL